MEGGKQKDPVGNIAGPLRVKVIKKYFYFHLNSQKKLVSFCFDIVLCIFTYDSCFNQPFWISFHDSWILLDLHNK